MAPTRWSGAGWRAEGLACARIRLAAVPHGRSYYYYYYYYYYYCYYYYYNNYYYYHTQKKEKKTGKHGNANRKR